MVAQKVNTDFEGLRIATKRNGDELLTTFTFLLQLQTWETRSLHSVSKTKDFSP